MIKTNVTCRLTRKPVKTDVPPPTKVEILPSATLPKVEISVKPTVKKRR